MSEPVDIGSVLVYDQAPSPVPATWSLRQAVLDRLALVDELKVYDGDVPQDDPPPTVGGVKGAPVRPYAVLHPDGGRAWSDRAVQQINMLDWSPQITIAAGHVADCLAAIDRVRAELVGQPLDLPDGTTGHVREPAGGRPLLVDRDVSPVRHYFPLLLQVTAS